MKGQPVSTQHDHPMVTDEIPDKVMAILESDDRLIEHLPAKTQKRIDTALALGLHPRRIVKTYQRITDRLVRRGRLPAE